MKRFVLLFRNEFILFKTTIPVHLIGVFQPALMFSLVALVLVTPTFDMWMVPPETADEKDLMAAMKAVGSPIGEAYINPVLVDTDPGQEVQGGQLIEFDEINGREVAVQSFGLIDSNMVKNFRNRLTAAALLVWNASLGDRAISIEQVPWLPMDMPYRVFFGMAMLPLAANLAAALIGAFINAQEFEFQTILEYRLSPISIYLISCARLCRLSITGLISGLTLLVVMGISTGIWPSSMVGIILVLLVMGLIGGCVGTLAGLNLQKVLPSFLIGLALSFFTWIMGSAFGLAAGFSGPYQVVSRFMPNTYAVELLFPYFFEVDMGSESKPILVLIIFCVFLVSLTVLTYRRKVLSVAKK